MGDPRREQYAALIDKAIEELRYNVIRLGRPLKTEQSKVWRASLVHTPTDKEIRIFFEEGQSVEFTRKNILTVIKGKLQEMGLVAKTGDP
ncbi:MAG: hypothetical protein JRI34_05165 [Deltaproteobacteria bacterium]|nr:hypothetical protein [Deltaproteobacteria bacterium]